MAEAIRITTVRKDDGDGLIVDFSDGTTAGYVAEELLKLRPHRELSEDDRGTGALALLKVDAQLVRCKPVWNSHCAPAANDAVP